MDYWGALHDLQLERQRLDKVIRNLEALKKGVPTSPLLNRGRKGMSAEERKQVSERMRNYWASRRQKQR